MKMRIDDYGFGEITINGAIYKNDIIIHCENIIDWWRRKGHLVQIEDLEEILLDRPDTLIIGKGYYGAMSVSPEVEARCGALGINLIAKTTQEATLLYNRLIEEKQNGVSAALHLTC